MALLDGCGDLSFLYNFGSFCNPDCKDLGGGVLACAEYFSFDLGGLIEFLVNPVRDVCFVALGNCFRVSESHSHHVRLGSFLGALGELFRVSLGFAEFNLLE